MKKAIFLILIVAVLAIAANDGGRLFVGKNDLRADTSTLSDWALTNADGMSADQAVKALVARSSTMNLRITQFGQDEKGYQLWTESDVTGLWVLGTYKATLDGVPLRQALGRSIVIKDYAAAQYR